MSDKEHLTNAVQENLITLLAFDDDYAHTIRNAIDYSLFEGLYRDIASAVYQFIDRFDEPPKDNLADLFDSIIEDKDNSKASLYETTLANLYQMRDRVNAEYTMSRLQSFLRRQRLRQGILQAAEMVQDDSEEALDQAENVLTKSMDSSLDLFDPGMFFNSSNFLDFLHQENQEPFPLGIPELDKRNIGPRRKELMMVLGGTKAGKSAFMLHIALRNIIQRYKVLYVSLEMSEMVASQRIAQMAYSFTQNENVVTLPRFEKDALGNLIDIEFDEVKRPSMRDPGFVEWVQSKQSEFGARYGKNLVLKSFPTNTLTTNGLEAYIDSLERMYAFEPDVVIVDYPKLFRFDSKQDLRLSLGSTVETLRGIAGERNMSMIVPAQANREGIESQDLTETDTGEDISQTQTADLMLSLNKTKAEDQLGLMRINVPLARNQESGFSVVVTQNLSTMQFAIDDHIKTDKYSEIIQST